MSEKIVWQKYSIGSAVVVAIGGGLLWFALYSMERAKPVTLRFDSAVAEFRIDYDALERNIYNHPQFAELLDRIRQQEVLLADGDQENDRDAYEIIAFIARQLGDEQTAILGYRASLAVFENNVVTLNNLAASYKATGDYVRAIAAYEMMLDISPGEVGAYKNLADAYRHPDVGREDEIVPLLEEGIFVTFQSAELLHYLAVYYRDIGEREKAIEYFEKVLKSVPDNEPVQNALNELRAL